MKTHRRLALDHVMLTGYPLSHMDRSGTKQVASGESELGEHALARTYPAISATLMVPLIQGQLAPKERIFDVHYHLLWLASLSDYESRTVVYTAYGLTRDMGWGEGGHQNRMLRRCVDHLWGMEIEIGGAAMPDPIAGMRAGVVKFKVLTGRGYPDEEQRKSGGRYASYISYSPEYLESVARDGGVQIDVEMLKEMQGGLSKGMYRTLSWLRKDGKDRILLDEAFERVGSNRDRRYPSDANRVFQSCFEVLVRYQYLKGLPEYETDAQGRTWMILEWGDTVRLPARGDAAYRELTMAGVHPRTAERMLREDRRRVADVLMAVRSGVVGAPRRSAAEMIVGLYNSEWAPPLSDQPGGQLTLDTALAPGYTEERADPEEAYSLLSKDDLLGRLRTERSREVRAIWLGVLARYHGVASEQVGFQPDGTPAP